MLCILKNFGACFSKFAAALCFGILLTLPLLALAQAPLLEGVCKGWDCNFCHLYLLLHKIINFLIYTLAMPIAALLFAWAGILYITAAGNTGQIGRAKKIFGDVLLGLLIAITAALVVDLILRTFTGQARDLRFWTEFTCEAPQAAIPPPTTPPPTTPPPTVPPSPPPPGPGCLDCVTLTGVTISPNACKPPSPTCTIQLNTIVATQVQTMDAALRSQGINMRATEGFPPTVTHQNACHQNGTCIDYGFNFSGATIAQRQAVITEAANAGLRAVFELPDAATCRAQIAAGLPASNVVVVSGVTPHYSIYSPGLSNGSGTPCPL